MPEDNIYLKYDTNSMYVRYIPYICNAVAFIFLIVFIGLFFIEFIDNSLKFEGKMFQNIFLSIPLIIFLFTPNKYKYGKLYKTPYFIKYSFVANSLNIYYLLNAKMQVFQIPFQDIENINLEFRKKEQETLNVLYFEGTFQIKTYNSMNIVISFDTSKNGESIKLLKDIVKYIRQIPNLSIKACDKEIYNSQNSNIYSDDTEHWLQAIISYPEKKYKTTKILVLLIIIFAVFLLLIFLFGVGVSLYNYWLLYY